MRLGFLTRAAVMAATALLMACSPAAPAAPTSAPTTAPAAKPTAASAPAPSPATSASPAPSAAVSPAAPVLPSPSALASPAAASQPGAVTKPGGGTKVSVAIARSISDIGIYVALDHGYFAAEGIDPDLQMFASSAEQVPLLATGKLDVGAGASNAAFYNAVAQGIKIPLVADKGQLLKDFGYEALMLRKDLADSGAVKTPADLKGKTIALVPPLNASAAAVVVDKALKAGGLTDKDVNLTTLGFAEINAALTSKSIDVGFSVEPNITLAIRQNIATRWLPGDEIAPGQQIGAVAYSPQFAAKTDLARAYMRAYIKGLRDYNDAFRKGINKDDIIRILAKYTDVTDPSILSSMVPVGMNPDGYLNQDTMKSDLEWYRQVGTVTAPVDMSQVIDNSFCDFIVQQLGKYQ